MQQIIKTKEFLHPKSNDDGNVSNKTEVATTLFHWRSNAKAIIEIGTHNQFGEFE